MSRATLFRLVPALGLTQIISWGALYYSIAVLGASIRDELGLSAAALFGAYSLSLLLSALTAPLAGRAIDRYGGRLVMSVGSVTAALALFAIAHAHSAIALYAAWALAGIAMAMTLYDAAFATLSQHAGTSYRTALTALTLMGGLASTAFWLEWFGWRDTLSGFALLQIAICLPLHLAFVPRTVTPIVPGRIGSEYEHGTLPPESRRPALIALGVAFALNGFIVSALTVHLITVLQGKGLPLESAVWVGA
ncbi:MAG: MFS transporter, partial [Betaproteobacteria bacterium]